MTDRKPQIDSIEYEYTNPREISVWITTTVETEVKMWVDYDEYGDDPDWDDDYDRAQNFLERHQTDAWVDQLYKESVGTDRQHISHEIVEAEFS